MAILNGPYASKMRGKVGEVVAAKTVGGQTALRSYQPNVKNPNTLRQQVSRNKMGKASELAAMLATAIEVGYAKAVQGMKMYARNLFVKSIVPVSAGVMTNDGVEITLDITKIKVAKAAGLTVVPAGEVTPATGGGVEFVPTNTADITLNPGESLGICLAAVDYANGKCIYKQDVASTGVTLSAAEVISLTTPVYFAFYKVIPEGMNGVASETMPWKYPSNTSDSVQVFTQA